MPFLAPIGQSDFRILRRTGLVYVDKSALLVDLLADPAPVILLPRPRRFGKTLNLSMVRYFLERPTEPDADHSDLFVDLEAWRSPATRLHFQRHPVLFLTFKDLKPSSWGACQEGIGSVLARLVGDHRQVLDDPGVPPEHAERLRNVMHGTASFSSLSRLLLELSSALHRATGQPAVVLIDEYDTPLHAAWLHGYFDEAVAFFRGFLGAGLKDNPSLFKGVLTGILRIARENLFSDLNNIAVYSVLSPRYADRFGFTEDEVVALAERAGCTDRLPEMRRWYNGYAFAGTVIYNPWSVLSFLARPEEGCVPHWVNTSGNELIARLLTTGDPDLSQDMETLLRDGELEKIVQENLVLRDIERGGDAVWTLLLFSGYLSARRLPGDGFPRVALRIPNREVAIVFDTVFRGWMEQGGGGSSGVRHLLDDLLSGRERSLQGRLQELVLRSLSYHDVEKRQPERVYHAFVLGLLVMLQDSHRVVSNPEAGYGRADVLVIPKSPGRPGVVMEFKTVEEDEAWEEALAAATKQIQEKDYAATLREAGARPIQAVGVVFDGKRVRVKVQELG